MRADRVCFWCALCVMLFAFSAYGDEISDLSRKAEEGDPQSQHRLAWSYIDGKGVKQDKKRGFQWMKRAADQGYAPAECDLGYMYTHGIGTTVNYKRALELYTSAAEKGNLVAQNNLGAAYSNGKYVQRNATKAFYWFKKAADQGSAIAQYNLGRMYEYGHMGFQKNTSKAVEWYSMAAENGEEDAKKALKRLGVPPNVVAKKNNSFSNPKNSLKTQNTPSQNGINAVLERARRGDTEAQFEAGRMYGEGDGVPRDYNKAREWYEKAAYNGHPKAQNNLGVLYHDGKGVPQDYKKAREWYEKAAAQNYGHAFGNLGIMYERGHGVKVDYKKAFEYHLKAAGQGVPRSMNQLGWFYEHGMYVSVDYKKAIEWYTKGADNGNPSSMNNLGYLYEKGLGIKQDYSKAREWYEKSAAKGNEKAKQNLARLNSPQKTPATKTANKPSKNNTIANTKVTPQNVNVTPKKENIEPLFKSEQTQERPRMAIRAFADRTGEGKAAADAIMEMMVTELSKAKLFNLIEREKLDEYIGSEINLGQTGLIDPSTAPATGKVKGLQYTMTGSITLLYYSEKASGVVIPILGIATQAKTAYVVIDIRILDNTTAEIVYASEQTGEAKHIAKGAAVTDSRFFIGGYSKKTGGLLQEAARDAVRKHVSAMRDLYWHI